MRVVVTGSRGMVGRALIPQLTAAGHEVVRLVRAEPGAGERFWDPETGTLQASDLAGSEALVHLAGESIASGRWTPEVKRRIRDSRVRGTRLLSETLAGMPEPPQVVVSASAVGFYGDRGDQWLDEESGPGHDFLADVCQAWEAAWQPAEARGIRVVKLRFGMILSDQGGALPQMLLPFRMGLGGRFGSGKQWMSWITLDDAVGVIAHALGTSTLAGAVNAVAPDPVTNATWTRTLAGVLGRPAVAVVPAFAARLLFGEMADALLLSSTRVAPKKLQQTGYRFAYPALEGALRHLLCR